MITELIRSNLSNGIGNKPLLGITIMLVEDSYYYSESIRQISRISGARLRRADSVISAHRHMKTYRPDVVLVDIGLPDGTGTEVIESLATLTLHRPLIIAMSGDYGNENETSAIKAGAHVFIDKIELTPTLLQRTVLSHLMSIEEDAIAEIGSKRFKPEESSEALSHDFGRARTLLEIAVKQGDTERITYCLQLLRGISVMIKDDRLDRAVTKVGRCVASGGAGFSSMMDLLKLLEQPEKILQH